MEDVILDRRQVFVTHVDVAVSGDACGLAVGRIFGYKMLPASKYFNERTQEFVEVRDIRAPIYMIDGVLQIMAPPGGEIDLEVVRDMMLWFRGELNLKWGTADSYQSTMMLQAFRKARIRSGVLSIDTTPAPYTEVKLAIKDERILMPPHSVLGKELRELEMEDPVKQIINHPPGGSKDCSDAVAGVVYILQRKEASYGRPVGTGRRRGKAMREPEPKVRHVRVGRRRLAARGRIVH
jgi:hypothetical protein